MLQLFFCFTALIFFAKVSSSGSFGMLPKDLLALTELKLYDTSPDMETLLSFDKEFILWAVSLTYLFLLFLAISLSLVDRFLLPLNLPLIYLAEL